MKTSKIMISYFKNHVHAEYQYLSLIDRILHFGEVNIRRNGETKSIFGAQMQFSLQNKTLPLLTTKRLAWKTCLHELIWFIRGKTSNKWLQERNVKIWNGNGSREFLDEHGFKNREEGDLGPIYGHQWRHFNASYTNCNKNYENEGFDQINRIVKILKGEDPKETKYSRRLVVSAWNPNQLDEMALPPCHVLYQFHVNNKDELSCALYQRSGDLGLGIPFNIASYSFLTHLIAHHTGLKPGKFVHYIGDCHIYKEHEKVLKKQKMLTPLEFPKVKICRKYEDINQYDVTDFEVENYNHLGRLEMEMKA